MSQRIAFLEHRKRLHVWCVWRAVTGGGRIFPSIELNPCPLPQKRGSMVCTRLLLARYSYVLAFHSYVLVFMLTRMYSEELGVYLLFIGPFLLGKQCVKK